MQIDIWLFTAVGLFILAFCAALRVLPGPPMEDRLLAGTIVLTLVSAGSLSLTVSAGDLIFMFIAAIAVFGLLLVVFSTKKVRGETL